MIGEQITADVLANDPHATFARLRQQQPVAWIAALDGWLITRYPTATAVMRDPQLFTVDDPRFTTARVVGPSMLSLDGAEHRCHRGAFDRWFRGSEIDGHVLAWLDAEAHGLVEQLRPHERADLRTALAAPFAVRVITHALGLVGTDPEEVLGWYRAIVDAVAALTLDADARPEASATAMTDLHRAVALTGERAPTSALGAVLAGGDLSTDEVVSNVAVLMFGAIETGEGMTANALLHLLQHPAAMAAVSAERNLVPNAIAESLRLEPAAAFVDRYATRAVELDGTTIPEGAKVVVSLTGANRDPAVFENPDAFDIRRSNAARHLAFARGPHACIGAQLARAESAAAITAVLDLLPHLELAPSASTSARGIGFRKPPTVAARWRSA